MLVRQGTLIAVCLWLAACGSSDQRSPLILSSERQETAPGLRALTDSQIGKLQKLITSAGESCAFVERTYLREVDHTRGTESWDVRCAEGSYSVQIAPDGTRVVEACFSRSIGGPCAAPYADRYPGRRAPAPLNPELGKLLEPLAGDGSRKAD